MGILAVVLIAGFIYSTFFKTTYGGSNNVVGLLLLGLLIGGLIAFLIFKLINKGQKQAQITESSHTVVESMRKVFKIVCAEGHFNEIYNYEETKKIFSFLPHTKKALVIVQAKVLIGYDFEKFVWNADENTRRITLEKFPEPEIISIEPDLKYYNMEEHFFNMFSREDLERIQKNAKKQVENAVHSSNLKRIAAEQMRTLLTEVVQSNKWVLENSYKITNELPNSTSSESVFGTPNA